MSFDAREEAHNYLLMYTGERPISNVAWDGLTHVLTRAIEATEEEAIMEACEKCRNNPNWAQVPSEIICQRRERRRRREEPT